MGWWSHLRYEAAHCGIRAFVRSATVALLLVGSFVASRDANALTAQTISFAAPSGKTFGAAPFIVNATASSGLAVTAMNVRMPVSTGPVQGVAINAQAMPSKNAPL